MATGLLAHALTKWMRAAGAVQALDGARLVYVDRHGVRCGACGSDLCPPSEAVQLASGMLVHVPCAQDPGGAVRGGR